MSNCNVAFARHIFPSLTGLWECKRGSIRLSDGSFGCRPLGREGSSSLGKGDICGDGGESRAEKTPDEAGSEDLEIEVRFASWVADDLLRTGGVNASTRAGVGTVDKIPLMAAGGVAYRVAIPWCLSLSEG
jgi:hypothetical protein